ncbi:MAG: zinc ribbon domain-containing protein, partial [Clostridia bacterium]|nr:zinc ribbon domain-containing protein [Clostridia bacterium]
MIEQRSRVRHFSGATIFSTKIRCGECGGWFGSKVWHSTDQYRRVIWRCNAKYGGKAVGCKTPHVTEEEVKAAFVRVVNKLIGNRAMLLADLREIQQTYSGTDELSQRLHELEERLNAEAEAVQELIAKNARVAQNQDDYNAAYDAAVSYYEVTKAEREKVA